MPLFRRSDSAAARRAASDFAADGDGNERSCCAVIKFCYKGQLHRWVPTPRQEVSVNETIEQDGDNKAEWIAPEMRELDVRETAFGPHTGGDGDITYPDCSRS